MNTERLRALLEAARIAERFSDQSVVALKIADAIRKLADAEVEGAQPPRQD